ncbi:MAG: nucleotide exchange factor GrpE [Christensenellales bacterium]|jgi:molecular chaperone GrpE
MTEKYNNDEILNNADSDISVNETNGEIDEGTEKQPQIEESPLEKALNEVEEYKNLAMRIQADFENYKKRNKELSASMYSSGITDTVMTVFPVIDSLELALNMYTSDKDRSGIELIIRQFMTAFEKLGVKCINPKGEEFNPELHEAVMKCDEDGHEPNKVVEVMRKGYMYKDKVIRPAMVKVSN